jgi:cbb3-type cytochrome oxidase maturation protein
VETGEALMSVFLILIPVSLALAIAFVFLCLASIRDGQFDDLESPRWRILFEGGPSGLGEGAPAAPFSQPAQPAIPARNIDDQG